MGKKKHPTIFAVDFDGTLATNAFPGIGNPINEVIDFCKLQQGCGNKLILWTNRHDERLIDAIDWCKDKGLYFDAINENLPSIIEYFGNCDTRKIFANYYIDDRAVDVKEIKNGEFKERDYL
jgi:hypothetical protein